MSNCRMSIRICKFANVHAYDINNCTYRLFHAYMHMIVVLKLCFMIVVAALVRNAHTQTHTHNWTMIAT